MEDVSLHNLLENTDLEDNTEPTHQTTTEWKMNAPHTDLQDT